MATGPYGTIDYDYDAIGNLRRNTRVSPTDFEYASTHPHAVTKAGERTYTYDANGNMKSGGPLTLEYDAENRPIRIVKGVESSPPEDIPPGITIQPQSQSVTAPAGMTISVAATGSPTPTYQWQRNGQNIPNATQPSYTLPTTTTADDGAQFQVVVSNTAGSVTSGVATLTVLPEEGGGSACHRLGSHRAESQW